MNTSRRNILLGAALTSATATIGDASHGQPVMPMHMDHDEPKPERPKVPRLPAILCRTCDTMGIDAAFRMLKGGADTLDAALKITTAQENNPDDSSTGIGGLQNEIGQVQLDACCFHGPTGRSAAVAGVSNVCNVSLLARAVLQDTSYPLLVGSDAHTFAISIGLQDQDLTTTRSKKIWDLWKLVQSRGHPHDPINGDPTQPVPVTKALPLPASQKDFDLLLNQIASLAKDTGLDPQWTWRAAYDVLFPRATPLYVSAVDIHGGISCAATTSGLPWRLPGAISDIAVLGAGCYLDPDVGSAGASGHAEANTKIIGAHLIVQNMKRGMSPEAAGMDALRAIVKWHGNDRESLRYIDITYYIQRQDGAYASVSLWRGDLTGHIRTFTVHDGVRRSEPCSFLLDGSPLMNAARL